MWPPQLAASFAALETAQPGSRQPATDLTRVGRQVGEELARVFLARRRRLPPKKLGEMKPGKRPPASPSNDERLLDGTLGSDPVHQDRPHHVGQTLWILDGAALIQKAD